MLEGEKKQGSGSHDPIIAIQHFPEKDAEEEKGSLLPVSSGSVRIRLWEVK